LAKADESYEIRFDRNGHALRWKSSMNWAINPTSGNRSRS